MNLNDIVQRCCEHKLIVSLVGAGGKTTTMYRLAEQCARRGKRVLVTTTTHIMRPEESYVATAIEARALWSQKKYATIGNVRPDGRLQMPDAAIYDELAGEADVVLIEADGSKTLPCKVPASHEPVIVDECNLVIAVLGMSALGRRMDEVCFRFEKCGAWLGVDGADLLDEEIAAKILSSEQGSRQYVGERECVVLLNQCDSPERIVRAEKIAEKLGDIPVIINSHVKDKLIVVRGAGDIATGTIVGLRKANYPVLALETARPVAVRRQVALSEAIYDGEKTVDGVSAIRVDSVADVWPAIEAGKVPVLVDEAGTAIDKLRPAAVIDGIIAKRNLGISRKMAPLTIAFGPGFVAGEDVDYVIETMRGETLGKIYREGAAIPNTGIPGEIGGYCEERVLRAPVPGVFTNVRKLGDVVEAEEVVAYVTAFDGEVHEVRARISGFVRGLLRDGFEVTKGFKCGDVDPRMEEVGNYDKITDKAQKIASSTIGLIQRHA